MGFGYACRHAILSGARRSQRCLQQEEPVALTYQLLYGSDFNTGCFHYATVVHVDLPDPGRAAVGQGMPFGRG